MLHPKKQVSFPEANIVVSVDVGDNLADVIRKAGLFINADCGGIGQCGKCLVEVNGVHTRACTCHVVEDIEVLICSDSGEGYEIVLESTLATDTSVANALAPKCSSHKLGIAIDIGTTTIAGKLLDLTTGMSVASFTELNSQTPYGSDVISRINCCLDDASELSDLITSQIDRAIAKMLSRANRSVDSVARIVIAGNTAMTYILLGLPCRSLGFAPFQPEHTYKKHYPYAEIFHHTTLSCECLIFPYISAYIGGDLSAGLCALGDKNDFILMDMGTNGEMIYENDDKIICTATAAGPAFEGGSIECGSGSTIGAISQVHIQNGSFTFSTIGAAPPVSLCGSGLLDLIAELAHKGIIDKRGRLDPTIESKRIDLVDKVFLSQKDIRQFQMAKSAVGTGVDVLIAEMGNCLPSQIFLAGGFGQNLNVHSAARVGLLPTDLVQRTYAIGNSSLSGAVKVCLDPPLMDQVMQKAVRATEINLATHTLFGTLFMENMSF